MNMSSLIFGSKIIMGDSQLLDELNHTNLQGQGTYVNVNVVNLRAVDVALTLTILISFHSCYFPFSHVGVVTIDALHVRNKMR